MEHEAVGDTNFRWKLEIRGWIVILQTTEFLRLAKNLKKIAVTDTPVKDHQVIRLWKPLKPKLCNWNLIERMNSWVLSLVKYSELS